MRKRLLAIIATAAMVVTMIPSMAFAGQSIMTEDDLRAAVATSGTYTLGADIELSQPIEIDKDKSITLDLGDYDITAKDGYSADSLVVIRDGGELVITGDEGGIIANNGNARVGIKLGDAAENNYTTRSYSLVVKGGTVEGSSFGISGNGYRHGSEISIEGGTIKGAVAIFHPQEGVLNVLGGTIVGETGIEMRSGELNVSGGTIEATGVPQSVNSNASGSTTYGAAIAVAQHTTKLPIEVNITGGTLKCATGDEESGSALRVSNPQNNDDVLEDVVVTIDGGLFEGDVLLDTTEEGSEEMPAGNVSIRSGKFKGAIERTEMDENYICIYPGDGSPWTDYVGEEEVKEALEGLKAEDTLDVYELESGELNNIPEGTKILNYTGKALKVNGKTYEYVEKEVVGDDGETYTEVEPITAPAAPVTPPATSTPESAVDTGDDSNTALPFAVAGLALAAMAVVVAARRRYN